WPAATAGAGFLAAHALLHLVLITGGHSHHVAFDLLAVVVTRLCLDRLKSARARREVYIGPWLPEPVFDEEGLSADTATELADDLSFALLLALHRLSPLERAAFLLRNV